MTLTRGALWRKGRMIKRWTKTPITAADLLNDRVLPLFEEHDVKLSRVLTDRANDLCGNPERHEYELYRKRCCGPTLH